MGSECIVCSGIVLDEGLSLDVGGLCQEYRVTMETVVEMVAEGVMEPAGEGPRAWRFGGADVRRMLSAQRLQHDLGVNLAGAALALDLLEELEALRQFDRHGQVDAMRQGG